MTKAAKARLIVAITSLCILWELLYGVGLVDSVRFSHPVGVLQVLVDPSFLASFFRAMLMQLAFIAVIGGAIGVILGALILRSTWLTRSILCVLRIGVWLPFLIFWALPTWPPRTHYWYGAVFWVVSTGITAVTLSTIYQFLGVRLYLGLGWREAGLHVAREALLQAFFISLISQLWVSPYGWDWFDLGGTKGVAVGYASFILLIIFLIFVNSTFRYKFDRAARLHGSFVVREITEQGWRSFLGAALLLAFCLGLWQIYDGWLSRYLFVSEPLDVLKAGQRLFTSGTSQEYSEGPIWKHLGVSLSEIFLGLGGGGLAAIFVFKALSKSIDVRQFLLPLIPLTYVVPIVLSDFWMAWVGAFAGPWRTAIGIALVIFFPFLQVLVGLADHRPFYRTVLALDEALPFAFTAMLVGEAINTTIGLGFFILSVRSRNLISEGIAISLMTIGLLVLTSSALRWTVKHFNDGGER